MHCPCQQWSRKGSVVTVRRRKQHKEWQSRTATNQGMNTVAAQERTRMLGWSMAKGSIWVGTTPGEDGNTINDEIAGPNEPTAKSDQGREHKQRFRKRCTSAISALPLLRGTRDARRAILAQWQATCQSQIGPGTQPVAHILIRKPP